MTKTDADLLDDAARAGWLYYVGGRTQDEIAKSMGVSRQRAQRLVSKAVGDGLVRIRLEHPIAELMTLAQLIKDKYNLEDVRIAPDVGANTTASLAPFAAAMLEDVLLDKTPVPWALARGGRCGQPWNMCNGWSARTIASSQSLATLPPMPLPAFMM